MFLLIVVGAQFICCFSAFDIIIIKFVIKVVLRGGGFRVSVLGGQGAVQGWHRSKELHPLGMVGLSTQFPPS